VAKSEGNGEPTSYYKTEKEKELHIMGCFGSKQKISKVDLEYLKKHTRYDEATIKEWFKGFRVSLLCISLSLSFFFYYAYAYPYIGCQQFKHVKFYLRLNNCSLVCLVLSYSCRTKQQKQFLLVIVTGLIFLSLFLLLHYLSIFALFFYFFVLFCFLDLTLK
jgi:hypothetical protein